jgi:hypothetical protein
VASGVVETTLPGGVGAVLVGAAPGVAELELGFHGAGAGAATWFDGPGGRAALVPVSAKGAFRVTVGAAGGLAGVIGLRGRAEELRAAVHGRPLASLVGGPTVAPSGSVTVRFEGGPS